MPTTSTNGRLVLAFDRPATTTRLTVLEQAAPLQVVRAFSNPDGSALVHLHNVSGGVLTGDHLHTSVRVESGAVAQLTTTGATRLYRCRPDGAAARQTFEAEVGPGSWLEYLPDSLIPFAGSRYSQRSRITLSPGAGLLWWEIVAAGRVAAGERFAYDRLDLDLAILSDERPIAYDRARLEPARRSPSGMGRLGPYNYLASFYICRVGADGPTFWLDLERDLTDWLADRRQPGQTEWGASALAAHGLLVRGLSLSGRELLPTLYALWQFVRPRLLGQSCPLPRKVY